MSPSSSMQTANTEAAHSDAHGTPELDADPTAFDDPVERAEWLEAVLCRSLDMDPEDAKMICGLVLDHFGEKDEVLDDELPNEVRSVFYTLEKKRILTFRRIEYEDEDGRTLRGFFWRFHSDWQPPEDGEIDTSDMDAVLDQEHGAVYEQLPEDCWTREAAS